MHSLWPNHCRHHIIVPMFYSIAFIPEGGLAKPRDKHASRCGRRSSAVTGLTRLRTGETRREDRCASDYRAGRTTRRVAQPSARPWMTRRGPRGVAEAEPRHFVATWHPHESHGAPPPPPRRRTGTGTPSAPRRDARRPAQRENGWRETANRSRRRTLVELKPLRGQLHLIRKDVAWLVQRNGVDTLAWWVILARIAIGEHFWEV